MKKHLIHSSLKTIFLFYISVFIGFNIKAEKSTNGVLNIPVEFDFHGSQVDISVMKAIKVVALSQLKQIQWAQVKKHEFISFFMSKKKPKDSASSIFSDEVVFGLKLVGKINSDPLTHEISIDDLTLNFYHLGQAKSIQFKQVVLLTQWPQFLQTQLIAIIQKLLQRKSYTLSIETPQNHSLYKFKFAMAKNCPSLPLCKIKKAQLSTFNSIGYKNKIVFSALPLTINYLRVFFKGKQTKQFLLNPQQDKINEIALTETTQTKNMLVSSKPVSNIFLNYQFMGKSPQNLSVTNGDILELSHKGFESIQKYINNSLLLDDSLSVIMRKENEPLQKRFFDDSFFSYAFLGLGSFFSGLSIFFLTEKERSKQFLFSSIRSTSLASLTTSELSLYNQETSYQKTMKSLSTVGFVLGGVSLVASMFYFIKSFLVQEKQVEQKIFSHQVSFKAIFLPKIGKIAPNSMIITASFLF